MDPWELGRLADDARAAAGTHPVSALGWVDSLHPLYEHLRVLQGVIVSQGEPWTPKKETPPASSPAWVGRLPPGAGRQTTTAGVGRGSSKGRTQQQR